MPVLPRGFPLGFLNPWLYTKGFKGLNDILGGNNTECGIDGFKAIKDWDSVSGLGTPNFGRRMEIGRRERAPGIGRKG